MSKGRAQKAKRRPGLGGAAKEGRGRCGLSVEGVLEMGQRTIRTMSGVDKNRGRPREVGVECGGCCPWLWNGSRGRGIRGQTQRRDRGRVAGFRIAINNSTNALTHSLIRPISPFLGPESFCAAHAAIALVCMHSVGVGSTAVLTAHNPQPSGPPHAPNAIGRPHLGTSISRDTQRSLTMMELVSFGLAWPSPRPFISEFTLCAADPSSA